jgi:hypothetical protein
MAGKRLIAAWSLVVAAAAVVCAAPAQEPLRPKVEVLYIPREDLPRAPGYADSGVFLPLSELLNLAQKAMQPADPPEVDGARLDAVYCYSIHLKGALESALALDGRLAFRAPSEGWSASLIDDGQVPWTAQSATTGTLAFLARIDGRTYLFARGPTSGTLAVRALIPVPFSDSRATLSFGRLYAPSRIEMDLGPAVRLVSCTVPSRTSEKPGRSATETPSEQISIWPAQESAAVVHLQHKAAFRGPSSLRVRLVRAVEVVGGGLEVSDDLVLEDRLAAGASLEIPLPKGMSLLRTEAKGAVRMVATASGLRVVALEETSTMTIRAVFAAQVSGQTATLGAWEFPAVVQKAELVLRSSEKYAPVLRTRPVVLAPRAGGESERRYECWGSLPALDVALVPLEPPQPPVISASLAIARNEATAQYVIRLSDPPKAGRAGLEFRVPPEWVLVNLDVLRQTKPIPFALKSEEKGLWGVGWDPATPPDEIHVVLHRVGQWGAPGNTTELVVPLVRLEGPRPSEYNLSVSWPDELEVRTGQLAGLDTIPLRSAPTAPQGEKTKLGLYAISDTPHGVLTVVGRDPDVQATVVATLSVDEDRARVRALIAYSVRLAPTKTFRFALPPGTGQIVKIEGEGIRETTLRSTPERDEWTVTTQQGVAGEYPLKLEWPLAARPVEQPIVAPEIRVLDVTSQRGFLLLEASETLRLSAETRNLAEADLAELPPLPWTRESRLLGIYRYIEPPYLLRVDAQRFRPEPPLKALVRDSGLAMTFSPDGERLIHGTYAVAPTSNIQFFEIGLPKDAQVWSVLVNGEGAKPARSPVPGAGLPLLIPLPAATALAGDSFVTVLYREKADPLEQSPWLRFTGPTVPVPVNHTTLNLYLPPDFEYLTFGGGFGPTAPAREPAAHFLRSAYYPPRILFMNMSRRSILSLTLLLAVVFLIVRYPKKLLALLSANLTPGRKEAPRLPDDTLAAPVGPPERPGRRTGCTGLVVAILIGGCVVIMLMIATPNFLESQVRAKVSRARTDLRSLAIAIEAYYVDNNIPPHNLSLLYQGPVKYITTLPNDPYAPSHYGEEGLLRYMRDDDPPWFWVAYSIGPDLRDDYAQIIYDPTNGTVSRGDIIRTREGAPTTFLAKFSPLRRKETGAISPGPVGLVGDISVVDGRRAAARIERPTKPMPPPAAPAVAAVGVSAVRAPVQLVVPPPVPGEKREPLPSDIALQPPVVAREAGLLSLQIEPLQSGLHRRFETLSGDSRVEIQLLGWKDFRRLNFIVWIAAFLLLVGAWLVHARAYQIAFVAGIGLTLLLPVAVATAWVPFANAAFQGVLFSLIAPLISTLWKRVHRDVSNTASSLLVLAAMIAFASEASATESPATSATGWSRSLPLFPPARILVPYDLGSNPPVPPGKDPLAFISREDFARLWSAGLRERSKWTYPSPILAEIRLDGTLVPETSHITGEATFLAANPTSVPATLALDLAGLMLAEWSSRPSGAVLESGPNGLRVVMTGYWAGKVSARFLLPCQTQGVAGNLRLKFPEVATGLVRVRIPFVGVVARGPAAEGVVSEEADGATVFTAPIRPGLFALSWTAVRSDGVARPAKAPLAPSAWKAEIETRVTWSDLAGAHWQSVLRLRSATLGQPLPSEVRLLLDPGLRLFSAKGEKLLAASAETSSPAAQPAQESKLLLKLADSPSAQIILEGVVAAPSETATQPWDIPGVRVPKGVAARTMLRLEIADGIEILAIRPQRLERRGGQDGRAAYSVQVYETAVGDWAVHLDLRRLRTAFAAQVSELFAPFQGFLQQAAAISLTPRAGSLHECILDLPGGVRVTRLEGKGVAGWIQSGRTVFVAFAPPIQATSRLTLTARADLPTTAASLTVVPLAVRDVAETRRSAAVLVSPDFELTEVNLAKASPRPPTSEDWELATALLGSGAGAEGALRAYVLDSDTPLRFGLRPIEPTSLDTVFNRVTVSEGVQSLDAVIRAEPRRGRLRKVEALLLLASPDPTAAARPAASSAERLQASGPALRTIRTDAVSERILRVVAELNAPQNRPVEIRFHFEQPIVLEEKKTVRTTVLVPANKAGVRAFLMLRPAFEGQLVLADPAGAQATDPASVQWPDAEFRILPADQPFELAPTLTAGPSFSVTRHARSEALRAVIEVMRQRTIVTADGFERHELEIVLQNQSEQFLKIALPYPRNQIALYETQVASRVVKATFGEEDGREVLLVPLIRTGLLDPELTVRVAYTASAGPSLKGKGRREQRLPDILGGVPVAQSAMVLMLPPEFKYSKFQGSLNRVELVDLEVDEALRETKKVQRLSELALKTDKADLARSTQEQLIRIEGTVDQQLRSAKQFAEAQTRAGRILVLEKRERDRQEQLMVQRGAALQEAEKARQEYYSNVRRLTERLGAPTTPTAVARPAVPPTAPVTFRRVGEVFVFRQLQGTGKITFQYASRQVATRRNDILFAIALTMIAGILTFNSHRLFATGRRVAALLFAASVLAIAFRVALDVTVPVAAIAALVLLLGGKRPPRTHSY